MEKETEDVKKDEHLVEHIVRMAGGRIAGRTRLHKIFYLLKAAGFPEVQHLDFKLYSSSDRYS